MSTPPQPSKRAKPRVTVLVNHWLGRTITYVLSLFSSAAKRNIFWRLAAALTFREIRERHASSLNIADPYIRFERFFAHDGLYLERFLNLVSGTGIFVDLLTSNWLFGLPVQERAKIISLFQRIENADTIALALSRRPRARENFEDLKTLDQGTLPEPALISGDLPEEPLTEQDLRPSVSQSDLFEGENALPSAPTKFFNATRNGFAKISSNARAALGFVGLLLVSIIALPFTLLGLLGSKGKTTTAIRSAAARRKLALQIRSQNAPASISNSLRKYEMNYGHDPKAVQDLAHQFETSNTKSILTQSWLDSIPIEHRVFVTSLLRKASKNITQKTNIFAPILEGLNAKNQRNIVQITGISPAQQKELHLFKTIKSSKDEDDLSNSEDATSEPSDLSNKGAGFSLLTSEEVLRSQGWTPQILNGLDLIDAIRTRNFQDVIKITTSREVELTLPMPAKRQLASFAALLDSPIDSRNPNFKTVEQSLKASQKTLESPTKMARLMNEANSEVLPLQSDDSLTLRNIWVRIANSSDNQVLFSEAIETLLAAYDAQPLTKISVRSVSFDTFLILDLRAILDHMKMWIDWELCGRGSLVAFAHLATLANDSKLFETVLDHIESLRGIPKALIGSLRNGFLSIGIHNVESLMMGVENTQHLEELDPNKKYLCLVEGGAGIRALRRLKGITENVVCGPVIPTDAPRYPAQANLKYIDDYIPKYSKRDMELAFEIDTLVETYIQKASDIIRQTNVNERYAEAVEIAHATMFFGIYQEALAVDVCETLLEEAKDYDGVIFLMNTANALGTLLPDALNTFGSENVFIGVENYRSKGVDIALRNIRQQLKGRTAPAAAVPPKPTDWVPAFSKWLSGTMNKHEKQVLNLGQQEYALLTLEHVNGYHDSYVALTSQSLKHMDVELFTSIANPTLNDYIAEGGFKDFEHNLTHCALNDRPATSRDWMPGLISELKQTFESIESPWFPKYKNMIHMRAEVMLATRLPQILDAVSYFRARFSYNRPQYVFTGPNQHTISRAASYAALAQDIPVYDFLILASTHHPRYRYPVAKYAYIYDPWYRDIFEDYMRMPSDKIRVSGPLFDYSKRLTQRPVANKKLKNKTHIVFFSQSGNFQNSCDMLGGIIKGCKAYDDVYITVKMHPHESPANLKHYAEFAAQLGVTDNINFIHQGDAVALINEASLVVQSFSNVGLDALLMKTPVITYKPPSNLKARIFLYEKDIGHVVKTKAALAKKIHKFLTDPKDETRMQKMAHKFAAENEHFLRADNAERVMSEVLNDIGKTPKSVT